MPLLPLSPFQLVLRQWEELAPQNSAQVLLVEGTPDADLVESAFGLTLRELGLGRIHFSAEEPGYSHEVWSGNPPAPLVSQIADAQPLSDYIQVELNRPFSEAPCLPYRAFALQKPEGCYLGLIYQQWVADSDSIRLILREWFLRIFGPGKARRKLIGLPDLRTARGPAIGFAPWQAWLGARDCYRWWRDSRSLTRFPHTTSQDYHVTLYPVTLASAQIDQLLLRTRAEGFTLNDLLIATLATTLGQELPGITGTAWPSEKGRRVAIATGIDLRPYLPGDLSETFGSLLAYIPVICRVPADNLLDLAQETARQTRAVKDPASIARKLMLPRLLALASSRQSAQRLPGFYQRHAPMLASVTNVNLNTTWVATQSPTPIRGFLQVASPLPAIPIALSATSLGDKLELTLAIQRRTVAEPAAQRLTATFAQMLQSLVQ